MAESGDVNSRDGFDELVAESFINVVILAECFLVFEVNAVVLGNLSDCGVGRMDWVDRGVDGRDEGDVSGACQDVFFRGDSEGQMALFTVASIGVDGGGVCVELDLGNLEGFEIGIRDTVAEWRQCGMGEVSRDGLGGGGHADVCVRCVRKLGYSVVLYFSGYFHVSSSTDELRYEIDELDKIMRT